jgi:hypothetical protein
MENKEAVTGQLTDNPNVAGANWSYVSPPQPIASAPDRGCISNSPNDLDKSSSEVAGAGTERSIQNRKIRSDRFRTPGLDLQARRRYRRGRIGW